MASAAPQKRMVSSVFITLASPCRATLTQQQHVGKTHNATTGDMQHKALRISPWDSVNGSNPRSKKESLTQDGCGSPESELKPYVTLPISDISMRDTELQADAEDCGSKEQLCLDIESLEDSAAPLPNLSQTGPSQVSTFNPVISSQPPLSDKQDCTIKQQKVQTSSGVDQDIKLHRVNSNPQKLRSENEEVCGFCRKPVALSEPAIDALNRTYHEGCFQCRHCKIPLAGKLYYNKTGIPFCEDCYQTSLELCWKCGEVIKDLVIRALERAYHPTCFICATCSQPIGEQRFAQGEVGEMYCLPDYYRKYAPQCSSCQMLIIPKEDGTDSYTVECLERTFHEDCYRCEVCIAQLSPEPNDNGCYPLEGRVLCKSCHLNLVQSP